MKKFVLRNFTKFTGKHLCQSLVFNKVAGLRPATLLKTRLWHSCFHVNLLKFLRTPFLQNTYGRLLLLSSIYYVSINKSTACTSRTKRYLNSDKNKLLFSSFVKSQFASTLLSRCLTLNLQ